MSLMDQFKTSRDAFYKKAQELSCSEWARGDGIELHPSPTGAQVWVERSLLTAQDLRDMAEAVDEAERAFGAVQIDLA